MAIAQHIQHSIAFSPIFTYSEISLFLYSPHVQVLALFEAEISFNHWFEIQAHDWSNVLYFDNLERLSSFLGLLISFP